MTTGRRLAGLVCRIGLLPFGCETMGAVARKHDRRLLTESLDGTARLISLRLCRNLSDLSARRLSRAAVVGLDAVFHPARAKSGPWFRRMFIGNRYCSVSAARNRKWLEAAAIVIANSCVERPASVCSILLWALCRQLHVF